MTVKIWESSEEIKNNWSVGSVPLWGEAFRETLYGRLKNYNRIYTIEEHLLAGGFGSFLLESGINCRTHCLDVAVCGEVGTQDYLKDRFGFNSILGFGINE